MVNGDVDCNSDGGGRTARKANSMRAAKRFSLRATRLPPTTNFWSDDQNNQLGRRV